jgi:hypothetical protein
MGSVQIVIVIAIVCVTAIVLTACLRRRGGVRGSLRAGKIFEFAIEIDATPRDRRVRLRGPTAD